MVSKEEETRHAPDGKSRILFGSCNSQEYPQPLWSVMASRNATAFVWAGDAIYAGNVLPLFVINFMFLTVLFFLVIAIERAYSCPTHCFPFLCSV